MDGEMRQHIVYVHGAARTLHEPRPALIRLHITWLELAHVAHAVVRRRRTHAVQCGGVLRRQQREDGLVRVEWMHVWSLHRRGSLQPDGDEQAHGQHAPSQYSY